MASLVPIVMLLSLFIWLGVSPRSSARRTSIWLLVLIVAVIVLDFSGIIPGSVSQ